jgi:hypothetical protein
MPLKKIRHIENRLVIRRWGDCHSGLCYLFMNASALFTESLVADLLILFCLLLLSLGRSLNSLSMEDIQGLNVKKPAR